MVLKIYTKSGDKGSTSLLGGGRVPKYSLRVHCYGEVDELNSNFGLLKDLINQGDFAKEFEDQLHRIQCNLFTLGSEIASMEAPKFLKLISHESILLLEDEIDIWTQSLPELQNFVLPGGHPAQSQAHICRCICRRVERNLVQLNSEEVIRNEIIMYFNRLSDWLFTFARTLSMKYKTPEQIWSN